MNILMLAQVAFLPRHSCSLSPTSINLSTFPWELDADRDVWSLVKVRFQSIQEIREEFYKKNPLGITMVITLNEARVIHRNRSVNYFHAPIADSHRLPTCRQ
jgi:hypothetical protein